MRDPAPQPDTVNEPVTLVRVAGLMRSGTNLLTWMLRQNFERVATATMLLGWKHGPVYRDRDALGVDEFVDQRYRDNIRGFVRDHPADWARLTASPLYLAAAQAQRAQSFAVALNGRLDGTDRANDPISHPRG